MNKNSNSFFKSLNNSLFKHYLKELFTVLSIPLIILFLFSLLYNLHATRTAFTSTSTEVLSKATSTMDNLFDVIYKNNTLITTDKNVNDFLLSNFTSQEDLYYSSQDITALLKNITISLNHLDSIHIYSKANDYFISNINSSPSKSFYDSACFAIYKNSNNHFNTSYRILDNKHIMTICYVVNKNHDNEGAVFFNIDVEDLMLSLMGQNSHNATLQVTNRHDELLMSSNPYLTNIIKPQKDAVYRQYDVNTTKDFTYTATQIFHDNFTLVYLVDKHTYYTEFYPLIGNMLLTLCVCLIALFVLSFFGTRKLYNSITKALIRIEIPNNDENTINEFTYITNNIISKLEDHHNAEIVISEKMEKIKKYQTLALQTQINPHFLFNTLNLITTYAMDSEKDDSPLVIVTDKLSDILRYSLNTTQYIVKIEDEIASVKKYIDIENIKWSNRIDFIFDIDDKLYTYYTLKMILQPVIENAIKHGAKRLRNKKAVITISAQIHELNIVFSIINNGPMIPEKTLEEIHKSLISTDDIAENNHIGLKNVNQRIKLVFGKEYGCSITSDENNTIVKIVIPAILKENNDFTNME